MLYPWASNAIFMNIQTICMSTLWPGHFIKSKTFKLDIVIYNRHHEWEYHFWQSLKENYIWVESRIAPMTFGSWSRLSCSSRCVTAAVIQKSLISTDIKINNLKTWLNEKNTRVHIWISKSPKTQAPAWQTFLLSLGLVEYIVNAIRPVLPIADGVWSCGIGFRFVFNIEDRIGETGQVHHGDPRGSIVQ